MADNAGMELIQGGAGSGSISKRLMEVGFQSSALRPWTENGRTYITVNGDNGPEARPIVTNDATLRKDEWIQLDTAVREAAQKPLRAVQDLRDRGLVYSVPGGIGTTVLQTQSQSDIDDAGISMDGLRRQPGDRPLYDIENLPLPIIYKDFSFSAREIETSRRHGGTGGGAALDVTMPALASRKVSELQERMLIGDLDDYSFGGGKIQGYTTYDHRATVDISDWNESTMDGTDVLQDVLKLIDAAKDELHYGPYVLYVAQNLSSKFEEDHKDGYPKTIRQRITEVDGIETVRTLEYLGDDQVILAEMDMATIRLVEALPIQTVQWETDGGMRLNFKVMSILVPQIRRDYNNNTGIVHGTVST